MASNFRARRERCRAAGRRCYACSACASDMVCDVWETLQYPISATSPTGSSRRLICSRAAPKIKPTGFAALETSMSKQYNQFNLEIRFDAAELALLRKLARQASLAAFEQK